MTNFRSLPAKLVLFVLAFVFLGGCAQDKTRVATETPELIPRELIFGNPERSNVSISPDGSMLAFQAPWEGVMNAWVQPLEGGEARVLTRFSDRPILGLGWAWNGEQLIFLKDQGGNEQFHLYSVGLDGGEVRDLTPITGVRATLHSASRDYPDEILISMNDSNPQFMNLYRLDVRTGERRLLMKNEGWASYIVDSDWRVRARTRMTESGGSLAQLIDLQSGEWFDFLEVDAGNVNGTGIAWFNKAGNKLFGTSSVGRDKTALVWWKPERGAGDRPIVVFGSDKADISNGISNPDTRELEAVEVNYLMPEYHVLNPTLQPDIDGLRALDEGSFWVARRTRDNRKWVVAYTKDDGPPEYWLWDRDTRSGKHLFTTWPQMKDRPLVKMRPIEIPTRDGLVLPSYLTLPKGGEGKAHPLVLLVHGGPWARTQWGYSSFHQWLANRGYAVLDPNFRGSTGFGKAFLNAGNREWYHRMQDDLNDAMDWAVRQGHADPKRVCIMGGSYGGYAALAGLTRDPERFACAVDIVGPSHVATLLESIPPYWVPMIKIFNNRVGGLDEKEWLDEISPLSHVKEIRRPLLIGQGANDPRVKLAESDQIVSAMQERGLPVTYVVFPDEGHGFARPENNMAFNAVIESFLAKHLGGRAQEIGEDLARSSARLLDKGGLELPGVELFQPSADKGRAEGLPVREITLQDLPADQREQAGHNLAQFEQMQTGELKQVREQLLVQRDAIAGQAPGQLLLIDFLVQDLDRRIKDK